MEIISVKIQGQGYLLNGTMSVPKANGNREYEAIKEWLKYNTPESEFTEAELAQQVVDKQVREAQALLDSTQFKFGDDYDQKDTPECLELKVKRQEAREFIRSNDVPNP